MMATPNFLVKTNSAPAKTGDAVNVAARYFVYKLYEATDRCPMAWHRLRRMGEAPITVARAVERGWAIVQATNSGRANELSGCLTEEGRAVARRLYEGEILALLPRRCSPKEARTTALLKLCCALDHFTN